MAILTFWSGSKKETCQTLSLVAIATYMSVEHNYKTLILDATPDDNTIERCFWKPNNVQKQLGRELNMGKVDITTGTEGLMKAIASNKASPEVISNYTKVVFSSNRLDVLLGLKSTSLSEHEKHMQLFPDLITAANKYYDLVMIDLNKTTQLESTRKILNMSNIIMYTMSQNLMQIEQFIEDKQNLPELHRRNIIPLLGSMNPYSKYNPKNVGSFIKDKQIAHILYNNAFMESACEGSTANFFLNTRMYKSAGERNAEFLASISDASQKIKNKFEELKYSKQ